MTGGALQNVLSNRHPDDRVFNRCEASVQPRFYSSTFLSLSNERARLERPELRSEPDGCPSTPAPHLLLRHRCHAYRYHQGRSLRPSIQARQKDLCSLSKRESAPAFSNRLKRQLRGRPVPQPPMLLRPETVYS